MAESAKTVRMRRRVGNMNSYLWVDYSKKVHKRTCRRMLRRLAACCFPLAYSVARVSRRRTMSAGSMAATGDLWMSCWLEVTR